MVATNDGAPKSQEFPKGTGIQIRRIDNRHSKAKFGYSFLVTVPAKLTGQLRERRQFTDLAKAKEWAETQFRGYRKQGEDYFAMTDDERREFSAVLPLIRKHGSRISDIVAFAVERMPAPNMRQSLSETVNELALSKDQRLGRGDLRVASVRDFRLRAKKFSDAFAGRFMVDITAQEIKTWLNGLKRGSRTNRNYLAIIGEIFRFAVQKKYVFHSPVDDLTDVDRKELCGRDGEGREPSILAPQQAEKLLLTALNNPDLGMLAPVTLALFCGLRTEEIKRLDWQNIRLDEAHPFVTIDAKMAKKRRIRHVDLPKNAILWLSLCPGSQGPIATATNTQDYESRFRKLQRLAGLGKTDERKRWKSTWENNAMRHSFGSYHYALSGNPLETSRQLGHKASDQVLFDHYRALATKVQAEAYFAIHPPANAEKVIRFA